MGICWYWGENRKQVDSKLNSNGKLRAVVGVTVQGFQVDIRSIWFFFNAEYLIKILWCTECHTKYNFQTLTEDSFTYNTNHTTKVVSVQVNVYKHHKCLIGLNLFMYYINISWFRVKKVQVWGGRCMGGRGEGEEVLQRKSLIPAWTKKGVCFSSRQCSFLLG